ncbi:putative lytic murein transglycosylase [Pseudomonas phage OBP]|uniref:transglycosylase n=1 Tax=Pseudomonas phage OBP TaxID=1124849 RepID=UPI000240D56A|nr:transglycosylase [Pseudomonas phage OBP]AEV89586.1 putative lytic murein transglycosylase [Pseudomonas phage OBP]
MNRFILTIFLLMASTLVYGSVGANPDDYTRTVVMKRFDAVKHDFYEASKATGMDMGDLVAIASIESTLNKTAKNKAPGTSSGLLGYTNGTWQSDRKAYHKDLGLSANVSKGNVRANLLIGGKSLVETERFLIENSHLTVETVRKGDLYMSHFLGTTGALRVINSNSYTPMSKLVSISKANRVHFVKPNGQVRTAREFRLYMDMLVKRERAFYAEEIQKYQLAKLTEQLPSSVADSINDVMSIATNNTSKYVGWSL